MVARATTTGAAPRAKGAAATSGRARTSLPTPASRLSRPGETTGRTPHLLRLRANPDGGEDAEESSSGGKGKPFFDLSVGDELLDFLEAGPKMRKWYGAPEKGTDTLDLTPKTAKAKTTTVSDDENGNGAGDEGSVARDAILVLDANTKIGEEVVLQLILKRLKVKALVSDAVQAAEAFGEYANCVESSLDDWSSLRRLLSGVKRVVVTGAMGYDKGERLMEACRSAKVEHVVLLSSFVQSEGLGATLSQIFNKERANLEDGERERVVGAAAVPFTIVRAGDLRDSNFAGGGLSTSLVVTKREAEATGAAPGGGNLSRADFALAAVACLSHPPRNLVLDLVETADGGAGGTGAGSFVVEEEDDWVSVFE